MIQKIVCRNPSANGALSSKLYMGQKFLGINRYRKMVNLQYTHNQTH